MFEKRAREKFKLSPGQARLWEWPLKRKLYLASAGEQGGKTSLGALWFKALVKGFPENPTKWKGDPKANYIIGAPTYRIMEQATKPAFLKRFKGCGKWNDGDDVFTLNEGGKIYLRSSKDVDSVVGITDCKGAWIDEGGKTPRMFFYNILSRCARRQGPILVTTTPYGLGWTKRDFIDAVEKRHDESVLVSVWPSSENPTYPIAEYERLRKLLPPQIFRRRLMGIHEQLEGLIYEWSEDNLIASDLVDFTGARHFGGIDWGFDHPMALVVRALLPDGRMVTRSITKQSHLSTYQQVDLVQAKHQMFHVEHWACGHDRPDMIEELAKKGIPAFKYFEFSPNYREVNAGNQKHAEFVTSRRLLCLANIAQVEDLVDEYATYCWEQDEEGEGREKARNERDDLMAAERYCTVGILPYLTKRPVQYRVPAALAARQDLWTPNTQSKGTDYF